MASETHSCVGCTKEYTTPEGLRYHYRNTECEPDGVDCPTCGETFKDKHAIRAHHSQTHGGPGIAGKAEVECSYCGKTIERKLSIIEQNQRFYCSTECEGSWKSEYQGAYRWSDDKEYYSGDYYGANWERQREKRLEVDEYKCVACGMTNEEHKEKQGRSLSVHHIRDIDEFRDPETNEVPNEANKISNLITMCRPCHKKWEGLPLRPEVPE